MAKKHPPPASPAPPPPFMHTGPLTVQQALRQAQQHEAAGRLQQAETTLRQILVQHPRHALALHQLGLLAYRVGRLDAAVDLVGQAVAADGNNAKFLANHAELSRLTGRLEQALASGRRAVAVAPDSATAHSNLGIACYDNDDLEAAERHQRRALELQPALAQALNNLGSILRSRDELDGAIDYYRQAIAANDRYLEPLNNLGSVLILAERPAEAVAPLQQALALNPNYADALCNLAFALQTLDQGAQARSLFQRTLSLRPDYAEAHQGMARGFIDDDDLLQAEQAARNAVRHAPDKAEMHSTLGQVRGRLGHFAAAEASFDRALELMPGLASALLGKGVIYMEAGRLEEAEALFRNALASGHDAVSARYYLTQVRKVEPGDANLAALAQAAADLSTLPPRQGTFIHFALGKGYDDTGEFDQAFRHYAQGCALRRARHGYDEAERVRVFDGIMRTFDRARMTALSGHGNDSTLPIFILGMPRSGTTLTEQIIASHPDVHGAGELYDLMQVASRSTLGEGGTRSFADNFDDLTPAHITQWAEIYLDGLRAQAPHARRVSDKMPANFFLVGLIHLMLPNARIIHMQRDPLDTCLSCFTRLFNSGQDHTYDLAELGRYYRRYHALMAHWRSVLPTRAMLDLSYEALVSDPEHEVPRLIDFCGLPWNDACLAPHENQRTIRTASVTQVRQPVYTTSVQRWRRYEQHLGPLIDALGDLAPISQLT